MASVAEVRALHRKARKYRILNPPPPLRGRVVYRPEDRSRYLAQSRIAKGRTNVLVWSVSVGLIVSILVVLGGISYLVYQGLGTSAPVPVPAPPAVVAVPEVPSAPRLGSSMDATARQATELMIGFGLIVGCIGSIGWILSKMDSPFSMVLMGEEPLFVQGTLVGFGSAMLGVLVLLWS